MVAREAMAYGRVVVATRVGGLVDAVDDGATGVLVPPGDVQALRAAVTEVMNDHDLRDRLGGGARQHAREALSRETPTAAIRAAYGDAAAAGST
jgi:glycosyltransferase involved in cell wall biosynthesis